MISKKRLGSICIMLSMILIGVISLTYFLPAKSVSADDDPQDVRVYGTNLEDGNVYKFKLAIKYEYRKVGDETVKIPHYYFAGFDPATYTYIPTTEIGIPLTYYTGSDLSGRSYDRWCRFNVLYCF